MLHRLRTVLPLSARALQRAALTAALLIGAPLGAPMPASAQTAAPVARVAMTAGEARRVDAAGRTQPLRLNTPLATGDRIITGKDAFAILAFVDDGRVSLRADSELLIREYRIDPAGTDHRLELELVRGAMRQISGKAAQAQPERYRLNTPVAAIGVRGTDFLAQLGEGAVETFVHQGAIVLLPRSPGCAIGAAGGCSPLAVQTAADTERYLRVQAAGTVERRTLGPDEVEKLFGIRLTGLAPGGGTGVPGAGVVVVAGASGEAFRSLNTREALPTGVADEAARLYAQSVSPPVVTPVSPVTPVPTVPTGPPAITPAALTGAVPQQLVWGRFSSTDSLPLQLPLPYATASEGRHVTVGELGRYALWRSEPNGGLDPSLSGTVDFRLAGAEAIFTQAGATLPATVQAASLSVNFDRATFSAGVTVGNATAGSVSFTQTGLLNGGGMFFGGDASQRVAGALSRDGKEAGYLFTKALSSGTFSGITLWNTR